MNLHEGESCPGAAECRETKGKPLWRYPDTPEDEVCRSCPFFPTKPEAVPDELAEAVSVSLSLAELNRGGARFQYPSALTPFEWTCLNGLTRGRDHAEALKSDRDRRDARKRKRERP